jgi:hypothetical protein
VEVENGFATFFLRFGFKVNNFLNKNMSGFGRQLATVTAQKIIRVLKDSKNVEFFCYVWKF